MGEIHGVEVSSRGSLYEQEDVPSHRSCRSWRFSMIAVVSLPTLTAREWGVPATKVHVEEDATVSAMSLREEAINEMSET